MAQSLPYPMVEVTISDGLRHLLGSTPIDRRPQRAWPRPPSGIQNPACRTAVPKWKSISLRRDGQRPLTFEGDIVVDLFCDAGTPIGVVRQTFQVFTARDGCLYASINAAPPDNLPARPVFRATQAYDPSMLIAFLRDYQPEQCFQMGQLLAGMPSLQTVQMAQPMRSAFDAMIRELIASRNL